MYVDLCRPHIQYITMDLPSHGDSPACDGSMSMELIAQSVYSTLQNHQLQVDTIIGHSFGGKVVLEMMKQHPPGELPKKAVVLDISTVIHYWKSFIQVNDWPYRR